jgi:hypothetical protein
LLGLPEQKGLTSALTNQGPYEFAVSGAGDDYIDLANTYPFVEAQILDDDDTSSDFVHSHELGCTSVILIRNVIRSVPLLDLPTSGLFFAWQVLLQLVVLGVQAGK